MGVCVCLYTVIMRRIGRRGRSAGGPAPLLPRRAIEKLTTSGNSRPDI